MVEKGALLSLPPLNEKNKLSATLFNKKALPYLAVIAGLSLLCRFLAYPGPHRHVSSVYHVNGNFTLTENFKLMLASDLFGPAVMNTAFFAVVSVMIQFFIALTLAVLLNRKFRGAKFLMFIAMIPMAITPTAVAIFWKTGLIKRRMLPNSVLMFLKLIKEPIVFMNAEGFAAVFSDHFN